MTRKDLVNHAINGESAKFVDSVKEMLASKTVDALDSLRSHIATSIIQKEESDYRYSISNPQRYDDKHDGTRHDSIGYESEGMKFHSNHVSDDGTRKSKIYTNTNKAHYGEMYHVRHFEVSENGNNVRHKDSHTHGDGHWTKTLSGAQHVANSWTKDGKGHVTAEGLPGEH